MDTIDDGFFKKYIVSLDAATDIEDIKCNFILNTIEDGWSVKKRGDSYIFSKKHEGRCQIYHENYLTMFIREYLPVSVR